MRGTCLKCNKKLSLTESVVRGMGKICAQQADREASLNAANGGDIIDLAFDPNTQNIRFYMDQEGRRHFNIYQAIKMHSPSGMAWGFAGSGPADFALNIVEMFMREFERPVTLPYSKTAKLCPSTWRLHQDFKDRFLLHIASDGGGAILGSAIRNWVIEQRGSAVVK